MYIILIIDTRESNLSFLITAPNILFCFSFCSFPVVGLGITFFLLVLLSFHWISLIYEFFSFFSCKHCQPLFLQLLPLPHFSLSSFWRFEQSLQYILRYIVRFLQYSLHYLFCIYHLYPFFYIIFSDLSSSLLFLTVSKVPHIQKQRHYFANKGSSSQGYGFSCGQVRM